MEGITSIFGIGVVLFLLSYITFNLNENHKYLKVIMLSLVFFGLIGIPKVMLDNANYCEIAVSSANTSIADYTAYEYERICFDNPNDSSQITFEIIVWAAGLFILWVVFYMLWDKFKAQFDNLMGKFTRGKK